MSYAIRVSRRMGARMGRRFAESGVPARNPFGDVYQPAGRMRELMVAWACGYVAASRPRRRPGTTVQPPSTHPARQENPE